MPGIFGFDYIESPPKREHDDEPLPTNIAKSSTRQARAPSHEIHWPNGDEDIKKEVPSVKSSIRQ